MGMNIVIRKMESKDYQSVAAIWRDVLGFCRQLMKMSSKHMKRWKATIATAHLLRM